MAEAVSSTMHPGRGSLVGLIRDAGLDTAPEVLRLQEVAASVQQYRYERSVSPHRETTRSTALWSAMGLDDRIRTALEQSGVHRDKLAKDLELGRGTTASPDAAPTYELHDDFSEAISAYLRQRTSGEPLGMAEVVLSILLSAQDRSRGELGRRLGDVSRAISTMQQMVSGPPPTTDSSDQPQEPTTDVPPPPPVDFTEFSGSVRELIRTFADDPTVTPGRIAIELQRGEAHRGYGAGHFREIEFAPTGPQASFTDWCRRVRALYDMQAVRDSEHKLIDGRLFLMALAELDIGFATQLDQGGVRTAMRSEVSVQVLSLPRSLQGGVSSEYVDPSAGLSLDMDRMGVAPYVSMLASVICDRDTPTPLSVGVFGEWGSGKSYFMALLRGRIDVVRRSDPATYWQDIRQIGFNAWHYADSNLWASLGDEIFRQLLQEEDPDEARQKQLRVELEQKLEQRTLLEEAALHSRAEADRLKTEIARARASRDVEADHLLTALKGSEEFKGRLRAVWLLLGIRDPVEQGNVLASELAGAVDEASTIRRALERRWGIAAAVLALLLLLVGTMGLWVPWRDWVGDWGLRAAITAASGFLATAITLVSSARVGLSRLRTLMDEIRLKADTASRQQQDEQLVLPLERLRSAEAKRDLAESQLASVVERVGAIDRELADLAPGQRLYSFLADRVAAGDYTRNLGLISTIRKDFVQLGKLMDAWRTRKETDEKAPSPIDRIVLYIDDLDRCSPRQVVQVLQAVHLLVALDLFVVVVGVDPRWLVRSLQQEYPKLLDSPAPPAGERDDWDAAPEDYLEKIFGIPFVLPGMQGHFGRVLRGIFTDQEQRRLPKPGAPTNGVPTNGVPTGDGQGKGTETVEGDRTSTTPGADGGQDVIQVRSAIAMQGAGSPTPPTPLSPKEIDMLALLDPLVRTPREAKRLANIYQMIRATRDLSDPSRFLGDNDNAGEYEAVVVLLGLLTAHSHLLGAILDAPAREDLKTSGGLMHRSTEVSWKEFVEGLEPKPKPTYDSDDDVDEDEQWSNAIVTSMTLSERDAWQDLWSGLQPVTEQVSLPNLKALQFWAERIRRFSFVMSPGQEPPSSAEERREAAAVGGEAAPV